MDNMLVKSKLLRTYIEDLKETFGALQKYKKLNLKKCTFKVTLGKFLGFMVSWHGIEASPKKIQANQEMFAPRMIKEVQHKTRRIVTLNPFFLRSVKHCFPFF